jgi:serine/threonine-protein kinase
VDETLLQFGPVDEEQGAPRATLCALCGQRFGPDGRFCPFDGEPLQAAPEREPVEDPLLGTIVDNRYQVIGLLGEGGMGSVYRVRHTSLGRFFALKALRRDMSTESDLAQRFMREAKAAAAISHPNVVHITDFGTLPSGQPYFVMELFEGRSLAWLIRHGGPIPAARAVRILRQVCEALGAAHAAGIIHRDLKPDNIHVGGVLADREIVKVLDFGLAKVAGASRLTRAGIVFGTPHYMSPEQALGEPVDHRADMYALGIVMYEMFTGKVPFEADTYMGVLTKHMYMAPAPPSQVLGGTRELGALETVTLRCLEKKPERRYADMAELLTELDRITHFADDGRLEIEPAPSSQAPPRKSLLADELEAPSAIEVERDLERAGIPARPPRAALWAAGAGGALLAVLALGWWASSGESASAQAVPSAAPATAPLFELRPEPVSPVPSAVPVAATAPAAPAASEKPRRNATSTMPRKTAAPTSAPTTRPKTRSSARPPTSGSEIVNPWGE